MSDEYSMSPLAYLAGPAYKSTSRSMSWDSQYSSETENDEFIDHQVSMKKICKEINQINPKKEILKTHCVKKLTKALNWKEQCIDFHKTLSKEKTDKLNQMTQDIIMLMYCCMDKTYDEKDLEIYNPLHKVKYKFNEIMHCVNYEKKDRMHVADATIINLIGEAISWIRRNCNNKKQQKFPFSVEPKTILITAKFLLDEIDHEQVKIMLYNID